MMRIVVFLVVAIAGLIAVFAFSPVAERHHARLGLLATSGAILAALLIAFLPGVRNAVDQTPSAVAPAPAIDRPAAPQQQVAPSNPAPAAPEPDKIAAAPVEAPPAIAPATTVQPTVQPPVQAAAVSPPPPPEFPKQRTPDRNGVSVTLEGLKDTGDKYVATIRIVNSNGYDVGAALVKRGFAEADGLLTDGAGGSCPMVANGDSFGSLGSADPPPYQYGSPRFVPIGAGGQSIQVLYFNKGRCRSRISSRLGLNISATFLFYIGDNRSFTMPTSFVDLPLR